MLVGAKNIKIGSGSRISYLKKFKTSESYCLCNPELQRQAGKEEKLKNLLTRNNEKHKVTVKGKTN